MGLESEMISPLQFKHYEIERVCIEPVEAFNETKDLSCDIKVEQAVFQADDSSAQYKVELGIVVEAGSVSEANMPYEISVKGFGIFAIPADAPLDDDERKKFIQLNGSAALLGQFRALVSHITSLSIHGTFILPMLNFVQMLEDGHPEE